MVVGEGTGGQWVLAGVGLGLVGSAELCGGCGRGKGCSAGLGEMQSYNMLLTHTSSFTDSLVCAGLKSIWKY